MFLNSKAIHFLLLFILCCSLWAQDTTEKEPETPKENAAGIFSIGVYLANPLGHNFVNQGLELNPGFQFNLRAYVLLRFTVGLNYNLVRGEVINTQLTGNYDTAQIRVLGGTLGYKIPVLPKFNLELLGGFGQVTHKNKYGSVIFKDRGFTLWLAPEFSYSFTKSIALYISPELRQDRMNIDVPQSLKSTFKNVGYFSVGAGIRFKL